MASKVALLNNLLLASVASAVPSSLPGATLAHRQETYQSSVGTILAEHLDHIFDDVTGQLRVPAPLGRNGGASVFVGFGGENCQIVQLGIDISVDDGKVSYGAWIEPNRNYAKFSNFNTLIKAGDRISLSIVAPSPEYPGSARLLNIDSTKQIPVISQDLSNDRTDHPFLSFDNLNFTDIVVNYVEESDDKLTLLDATLHNIEQGGVNLTTVTIVDKQTLIITRSSDV